MQGTSANYNPYVDEIRTDALIEFELIDVDAAQTATSTVDVEGMSFSNLAQTHDRITQNSMKLATLDRDLWRLDGSFSLPYKNGDNLETGYFSSILSDVNGNIDILMTFTFPEAQSSDGFTIIFDTKEVSVADTFTVTTYRNNAVTGAMTISGNTESFCPVPMQSEMYDKVEVHFTKTDKPYRRIRVCEVVFGHLQQFKGNKIQNLRVRYEAGLYMEKMPANTLQFTIDNSDRAYNVLNPTGIYRFLQEGQGINCSITINGESVSMGRFFFETATANDDGLTATVTAYDLLWRLDKGQYNSGRTGTWTVLEAIQDVVADSGVEMVINIDSNIGSRVIRRCIPEKTTHREALRMIAQAGRCVLYFNRIGELKAKEYNWSTAVDHLTPRNMRGWGEATDRGLVNNVIVEASDDFAKTKVTYTANDRQSGEPLQTMKVDNPLANGNEVAEWILSCCKHRNTYNTPAQSNPARDIGDTINISNVYGTNDNAVIILQDTNYTGYILDTVQAFGGGNA